MDDPQVMGIMCFIGMVVVAMLWFYFMDGERP